MSAITRDPETRGGEPCIAGTRIPVAELLAELAGCSVEYKANDYGVSVGLCCKAILEAAVEYAKFEEQAKLLRDIGRLIKDDCLANIIDIVDNKAVRTVEVRVDTIKQAEDLCGFLFQAKKAAEAGGDDD